MFRPNVRRVVLAVALILFFPLYGCMVIAPLSLLTISFLSTKVPASWWLIFINPLLLVGVVFNYSLALVTDTVLTKRLSTEKARNVATGIIVAIIAAVPFIFRIYGWAGPTGQGEWANFLEFTRKAFQ